VALLPRGDWCGLAQASPESSATLTGCADACLTGGILGVQFLVKPPCRTAAPVLPVRGYPATAPALPQLKFWAVDTTAGANRKLSEFKSSSLLANTVTAKVSLPPEWPVGLYRLDVKMDGTDIGLHEYDVAEPE